MDQPFHASEREHVRLSDSPQRTPHISLPVHSPTKSVHPEVQIDSMLSKSSFGHHATDFFDDSSEEDRTVSDIAVTSTGGEGFDGRKRVKGTLSQQPAATTEPVIDHHSRHAMHDAGQSVDEASYGRLRTHGSSPSHSSVVSFNDSVNDLLQPKDAHVRTCMQEQTQHPHDQSPSNHRQSARASASPAPRSSKADHLLSAHAIAHEITLQALLRDEETTASKDWMATDRQSLLPSSPRPAGPDSNSPRPLSRIRPKNRTVSVVPPPFDPSMQGSLPPDLVRTPYPHGLGDQDPLDKSRTPSSSPPGSARESSLHLSLRRSNRNSSPLTTIMKVPKPSDFAAVKTRGQAAKELHFKAIAFDDEALCVQLRRHYRQLAGHTHIFSARSLSRITVVGSSSGGSKSSFPLTEQQLMTRYKRPKLAKSQLELVRWVHGLPQRCTATSPSNPASSLTVEEKKQSIEIGEIELGDHAASGKSQAALEFVVTWSWWRIFVALVVVMLASIATAVCWTLLGTTTPASHGGGFREAGDRVAAGVLMGVGVLLLGLSSIAGWLGLSWLLL